MSVLLSVLAGSLLAPGPEVQRPTGAPPPASAEPATETEAPADGPAETPGEEAPPSEAGPESVAAEGPEQPAPADPEPVAPVESAPPEPEPAAEPEPTAPATPGDTERFTVAAGEGGPPYYTEADQAQLRQRHEIAEPASDRGGDRVSPVRWRCLIADPTCGVNFEVNATAAYAYRGRQGNVSGNGEDPRWSSGRAQYDFWMNLPVMVETRGRNKFTRMTLGPKGGVIFSDSGSTWGNLGMAMRYWFGRGRWAPTLEFTSALSYKIGERTAREATGEAAKWRMSRGPVGFTADVGFGLGGFGAIVVGGQYDSPLAREDVPEQFRVSAGGAFFVGFRGNILWGGPAAAAILTHGLTQRTVEAP